VTVGGIEVLDECPTCAYGSLDLSPGLFQSFANTDAGTVQITWWFDGSVSVTDRYAVWACFDDV
jgi:expansin (peptidoglycan-binding protein)